MAVIKIVPMPGAKGDQGDQGPSGAQGPQGETGAQGPAGADALWTYNGEWQSNATYAEGDVVTYDGQTYYATGITTLGTTPDADSNFDLIVAKGDSGTQLNFWNFVGYPGVPSEDGALVVDGISARTGGNATIFAEGGAEPGGSFGKVVLSGSNGEFLNDSNVPENQIATVGDIESIDTLSNGLVVTGLIDDPVINPAGTMSLSVQDGYTALVDLVALSATFNGDVQITNLGPEGNGTGERIFTIETPTIINNEVTVQTEFGEGWTFDNDGYILGPWLSPEEDPANTGRYLRVTGITRADNNPLLVSSSGPVLINGTTGEFLNNHGDPNNQIATIGDINNAIGTSVEYSPVWSDTTLAYTGDPATGYYTRIGNIVFVQIDVDFDNVSDFGSGQYRVTLPFNSRYHTDVYGGSIHDQNSETRHWSIKGHLTENSNSCSLWYISSSAEDKEFDFNSPVTLTTADKFHMWFMYECID